MPSTGSGGSRRKKKKVFKLCSAYAAPATVPLLQRVAEKFGWQAVDRADAGADLYWVCQKDKVLRLVRDLPKSQLIGRYPRMNVFCNKVPFAHILQQAAAVFPDDFGFWARTYMLPGDEMALKEEMQGGSKKQFWILKPDGGSQGVGIFLSNSWDDVANKLGCPASSPWIAQHYMPNPYLLDGMKFDLRLYVLLSSAGGSFRAFLAKEGLVRLCTQRYRKPTQASKDKVNCHLTNYSLNKHSEGFVRGEEDDVTGGAGSKRSLSSVLDALRDDGEDVDALWEKLCSLVGNTIAALHGPVMEACEEAKNDGSNLFQVLGFDVLLDSHLEPLLLEVNNHPSLAIDTPVPLSEAELLMPVALERQSSSRSSARWDSESAASTVSVASVVSSQGSSAGSNGNCRETRRSESDYDDDSEIMRVETDVEQHQLHDLPEWALGILDNPTMSDIAKSFGSPSEKPMGGSSRGSGGLPRRSKSCPGREFFNRRNRGDTRSRRSSFSDAEGQDDGEKDLDDLDSTNASDSSRELRLGGVCGRDVRGDLLVVADVGRFDAQGRRKDRGELPHMEPRSVPVKRVITSTLEDARTQQAQRFGRLAALHQNRLRDGTLVQSTSASERQDAGTLTNDSSQSSASMNRSTSLVSGPVVHPRTGPRMSAELARRSTTEFIGRVTAGRTPPRLSPRDAGGQVSSRRPVETGGSRLLPLSPSTPLIPEDEAPQPRTAASTTSRARSALKKPVWGSSNGGRTVSKRVVYEVPSKVKPKPLLRPATGTSPRRAGSAQSSRDGGGSGVGSRSTTSSRRIRNNYIPDGECRCKDCNVPHKHIVSPVDEFVKLGTMLASLKIVRRMHREEEPMDEVTMDAYTECHPSLTGDDEDEVVDDHGYPACCSSMLAKVRAVYLAITSARTGNDGGRLRYVEPVKLRRWATSSGLFAPDGPLKSVDYDILVRQWRSSTSPVQEAVGSSLLGFMDLMLAIAAKACPDLPLAGALSTILSEEDTPSVGREEWVK